MKKACFLGIVVLMALTMVTCDNFTPPEVAEKGSNVVGYTEDGRAIMELSFGTPNSSRALHKDLSEAVADFYEVIFVDPAANAGAGEIYRTSWREGKVAKLRVPAGGNYNNIAAFAYIFAGRYSDKTLLGIGTIDELKNAAGTTIPGTTITAAVVEVVFKIEALETDVNDTASSTFKTTPNDPVSIKIEERDIPVFQIDDSANTPASFNVTLSGGSTFVTDYPDVIVVAGLPSGTSKGFLWAEANDVPITSLDDVVFPDFIGGTPAIDIDDPLTFPIDIELHPDIAGGGGSQAESGLCIFYIEVPVYLYDTGTAKYGDPAQIWKFRGGLNNSLLDTGYAKKSAGGAILLSVGSALDGGPGSLIIGGKH
jgi:hypothetical protein